MSESGTDYTSYNNTVFSGTGSDTVFGSSGNDTFIVAQSDTLATAGNDTFNGISGSNTIDYSLILDSDSNQATGGINVTLNGSNPVAISLSGGLYLR
jgi:Ca2+-binding RTX toxin-like protein